MYKPRKPGKWDTVILIAVITVIVAVEIVACGIAGWNFYRYVTPLRQGSEGQAPTDEPTPVSPKPSEGGPTLAATPLRPTSPLDELEATRDYEGQAPTTTPTLTPTFTLTAPAAPTATLTPTVTPTPTITPTPIPTPVAVPQTVVPAPDKWIVVDLSEQYLWAYEKGQLVLEAEVSTGTDATPTVTGEHEIWVKLASARMTGPGYDLPDVPYIMYFYKAYGLHGTYWHDNFGHPMSHGCVNLRTEDAKWLFDWTDPVLPEGANAVWATEDNPGTLVVIQP